MMNIVSWVLLGLLGLIIGKYLHSAILEAIEDAVERKLEEKTRTH
jgi:hypothetical protein